MRSRLRSELSERRLGRFAWAVAGASMSVLLAGCGLASGPLEGQPTPLAVPRVSCGQPIAEPLVREAGNGMRLAITSVTRPPEDGPPVVTVSLTADSRVAISFPGAVTPEVLLVRDGLVLGRLGSFALAPDGPVVDWIAEAEDPAPTPGGRGGIGRRWDLEPGVPHPLTVTGSGRCGVDWASAWSDPARHALVAVMSQPWPLNEAPPTGATEALLISDDIPLRAF